MQGHQAASLVESLKSKQRSEMNALIVEEEKKEQDRQQALESASADDRKQLLIQHSSDRQAASQRVRSLIQVHMLELQRLTSSQSETQETRNKLPPVSRSIERLSDGPTQKRSLAVQN